MLSGEVANESCGPKHDVPGNLPCCLGFSNRTELTTNRLYAEPGREDSLVVYSCGELSWLRFGLDMPQPNAAICNNRLREIKVL